MLFLFGVYIYVSYSYHSIPSVINVQTHKMRPIVRRAAGVSHLDPLGLVSVFVSALPKGLGAAIYERPGHSLS